MADRDRERVGRVRGVRFGVESEDELHHPLHLSLLRPPVPADRLLDPRWRVLGALDPGGRGRDEHGAASLTDGERDAGVGTHVGLLERDGVRRVLGNELLHALEDRHQPRVQPPARWGPPAPGGHRPEAAAAFVDDPVPARSRPGVDAEDLHGKRLSRPPDVSSRKDVSRMRRLDARTEQQLAAIAEVDRLLGPEGIEYWLFGGWAVDFHADSVTRRHDDVDLAVWLTDLGRITELLERHGRRHAPDEDEDGGTGFERAEVRLELTYLVRAEDGAAYTPLRQGRAPWSRDALTDDIRELLSIRSRVVGLGALARGKSRPRDDPDDAAKDRADFAVLGRLRG